MKKGLLIVCGLLLGQTVWASSLNGFNLEQSLIPAAEIHQGGPPRDGIPALTSPKFIKASHASFLEPNDRVLGVHLNGQSKAYPISIMNWHEIVNDHVGNQAVVVTYCPLCGSGVAFSAVVNQQQLNFGVSGLLYNSDVLLYDRESESLWSQLLAQAITGRFKGSSLKLVPMEHTRWQDWLARFPDTLVLSEQTGYRRDYHRDPYAGYEDDAGTYFPISHHDARYHPKERVLGIEIEGHFRAYPFAELSRTQGVIREEIQGISITIQYDAKNQTARALDASGQLLPGITAFWFAWMAFHPDSSVFQLTQ